jgi:hypothetical protein
MNIPGFTAESCVKTPGGHFHALGTRHLANRAGYIPAVFGPPRPPYPNPGIFGSYCDYATGKRWCIGFVGRRGAVGQFQCGWCGGSTGTPGQGFSQF